MLIISFSLFLKPTGSTGIIVLPNKGAGGRRGVGDFDGQHF